MERLKKKLHKMVLQSGIGFVQFCVMFGLSLIPGAVGQFEYNTFSYNSYNCDKYCHASCSDYFGQNNAEFSTCVSANVHCNCLMMIRWKNPFFLFSLVVIILMVCICCAFCHRTCSGNREYRRRRGPHHIVAQPFTGNDRPRSGSSVHILSTNAAPSNNNRNSPGRPFIISLGLGGSNSSQKKDLPPEYLPPPPYNECIINVDSQTTAPQTGQDQLKEKEEVGNGSVQKV